MMLSLDSSITLITVAYTLRLIGVGMIMMPLTTAGINSLPPHLIPHGTAMNNTMRQMGGSIGTAVLVSIMSSSAANAALSDPMKSAVHGMNTSFIVSGAIAVIGLVLSFFLKKNVKQSDEAGVIFFVLFFIKTKSSAYRRLFSYIYTHRPLRKHICSYREEKP